MSRHPPTARSRRRRRNRRPSEGRGANFGLIGRARARAPASRCWLKPLARFKHEPVRYSSPEREAEPAFKLTWANAEPKHGRALVLRADHRNTNTTQYCAIAQLESWRHPATLEGYVPCPWPQVKKHRLSLSTPGGFDNPQRVDRKALRNTDRRTQTRETPIWGASLKQAPTPRAYTLAPATLQEREHVSMGSPAVRHIRWKSPVAGAKIDLQVIRTNMGARDSDLDDILW